MLRISKLADYAILVMSSIASHQHLLSAKDIASDTKLAEPTVSKLLKLLARSNLLQSERGAKGGYKLIRPTANITVLQIIEAIDGRIAMTECDKENSYCAIETICTVSKNWQKISGAIRNALKEISLADMQAEIPETKIHFDFKRRATS
jgi:FeS assembly SUF system regulator